MLTPEEKILISVYGSEVFSGRGMIKQRWPRCCGCDIDLFGVRYVRFLDIEVFGRRYTLIEPECPLCGRWVRASYYVVN